MSDSVDDYSVPPNVSEDVEMTAQDIKDSEEQQQETHEMTDLFGQDDDHGRSVSPHWQTSPLSHQSRNRAAPASPTADGPELERAPSPDAERRQALEYEEEDIPPEIAVEVKEAHVKFPNLPVPKSSDGNVSLFSSISR
jgi:RNA polymerase-associated protein LEO1